MNGTERRGRRIVIIRHGERVDFTFGHDWYIQCFSENGKYEKINLNLPDTVPDRKGAPHSFHMDCPLTEIGNHQGYLVGKGITLENLVEDFEIYCSPSLRCVETATNVLKGMNVKKLLKIEPALFEYTGWTPKGHPSWMTHKELEAHAFEIEQSYVPFLSTSDLQPNETVGRYYDRSHELVLHLLKQTGKDKDLLLVAHGATLDSATRQLLGGAKRENVAELMSVARFVPYCGVAVVEQHSNDANVWTLVSPSKMTMKHTQTENFNPTSVLAGIGGQN